jgi:hypothetical protein
MTSHKDRAMLGAPAFVRRDGDCYFTLDAEMCVDALLHAVPFSNQRMVLEPCAGRGHIALELATRGYQVGCTDLVQYADPLVPRILQRDVMTLSSTMPWAAIITNLPYQDQDKILRHLLPIAHRDGTAVAILTRSSWHHGVRRRDIVHNDPFLHGIVYLPRRPWWSENRKTTPRFDFCWVVWGAVPRQAMHPAIFYPKETK